MAIDPTNPSSSDTATTTRKATAFSELDSGEFLKLLITELSNQDPLNPMDNAAMVQQVSTIREIAATTELSSTLEAVSTGQNLATATALIGKNVKALNDKGADVTGVVDKVTVEVDNVNNTRSYRVLIGDQKVQLKNVREVLPST